VSSARLREEHDAEEAQALLPQLPGVAAALARVQAARHFGAVHCGRGGDYDHHRCEGWLGHEPRHKDLRQGLNECSDDCRDTTCFSGSEKCRAAWVRACTVLAPPSTAGMTVDTAAAGTTTFDKHRRDAAPVSA